MKLWDWEKKTSTSPGRLKRGDIFCFEYDKKTYCFGRIIEIQLKKYCIIEFLDHISDKPQIDEETILKAGRLMPLMNVNCDSVFYSKSYDIDTRIIGHQDDFFAPDYDEIGIIQNAVNGLFKEDLHGNLTKISEEDRSKYISPNWKSSDGMKADLTEIILQKKYMPIAMSKEYPADEEDMYLLVDILFDVGKYENVIDALSSYPEEKQSRRLMGLLLASFNNTGHYDEALKYLEKYKGLYEDKMRLWYYYSTYALIGKKHYDEAEKHIEAGIAECDREQAAGTLVGAYYTREILDFKQLGKRIRKETDGSEKKIAPGSFEIEGDVLKRYVDDGKTEDIIIPDGIKKIYHRAFENCEVIKSVVIPEGVEDIGTDVFAGCTKLEKITFPSTIKNIARSRRCLEDTKWFKEYPKGQVIAGNYLFQYTGDEEVVVIKDGVSTVGTKAFLDNKNLKKIVIPSSVKNIHATAFSDCTNLVDVEMEEGLEFISSYAFGGCSALEEITLPSSVNKLANDVFIGCTNLKHVNMPDTLKVLDGGIFYGCTSLETIHLPAQAEGITDSYIGWDHQIGGALFKDCVKLREVTFPKGIKKILEETFAGCTSIQKIVVENPSMTFGKDTFGKKAKYPEVLYETSPELPLHLTDGDIKQYIDFDKLTDDVKAKLFVTRQSKSLAPFWESSINKMNAKVVGEKIKELQKTKLSTKEKKNAELFFEKFGDI